MSGFIASWHFWSCARSTIDYPQSRLTRSIFARSCRQRPYRRSFSTEYIEVHKSCKMIESRCSRVKKWCTSYIRLDLSRAVLKLRSGADIESRSGVFSPLSSLVIVSKLLNRRRSMTCRDLTRHNTFASADLSVGSGRSGRCGCRLACCSSESGSSS